MESRTGGAIAEAGEQRQRRRGQQHQGCVQILCWKCSPQIGWIRQDDFAKLHQQEVKHFDIGRQIGIDVVIERGDGVVFGKFAGQLQVIFQHVVAIAFAVPETSRRKGGSQQKHGDRNRGQKQQPIAAMGVAVEKLAIEGARKFAGRGKSRGQGSAGDQQHQPRAVEQPRTAQKHRYQRHAAPMPRAMAMRLRKPRGQVESPGSSAPRPGGGE